MQPDFVGTYSTGNATAFLAGAMTKIHPKSCWRHDHKAFPSSVQCNSVTQLFHVITLLAIWLPSCVISRTPWTKSNVLKSATECQQILRWKSRSSGTHY